MELFQLRQFSAIAEFGNMREAADHLYITPSAMSQNLKKLEEELGTPLFDRAGRRLVLNEPGRLLLKCTRQVESELAEFRVGLDHLIPQAPVTERPIVVGGDDSGFISYVLPLCLRDKSGFDVLGKQLVNTEAAFTKALLRGEADVTVGMKYIGREDESIISVPILERQLFISVPESNELYDRKVLTPIDLDGQRCLQDYSKASSSLKSMFAKMGVHPIRAYQCDRSSFPLLYDNPELLYLVNVFRLLQYRRIPGRRLIKFEIPSEYFDPLYYMSYRKSNPYAKRFYEWFMGEYYEMFKNIRRKNFE
ncbi:MAG: LysR family transcriptional regulator [Oscillospiraceae bacterium]|nr:LysR family transcriptional regulator [Oscillospiraceae bacterium]